MVRQPLDIRKNPGNAEGNPALNWGRPVSPAGLTLHPHIERCGGFFLRDAGAAAQLDANFLPPRG